MKISILPKSLPGKWSLGFIAAFMILISVFFIQVGLGARGRETITDNLNLAIPVILAGVSGVSALVIGLVGTIRNRDHSVLVFLSMLIGIFVLVFILGELLVAE